MVLCGLTVAILTQVLLIGLRAQASERRQTRFLATWKPIMSAAIVGEVSDSLPPVHWKDQLRFLLLWNRFQQSVRGPARETLNGLLRATGMHRVTRFYLEAGSPRARMVAITTTRYLAPPGSIRRLLLMAREAPGPVSVAAARTLAMIDPAKNLPKLIPVLLQRRDWSTPRCLDICRSAGTDNATASLLPVFQEGDRDTRERLLPLLECVNVNDRSRALRSFLEEHPNDTMTAPALDLLAVAQHPQDTQCMRDRIDHPRAQVRAIAASALGQLGSGREDMERLVTLLSDADWHVRQAAASALVGLHEAPMETIRELARTLPDPYGRNALQCALESLE